MHAQLCLHTAAFAHPRVSSAWCLQPLGLTHTWVSVDDNFALNELGRGKADLQQPRPEVHVSVCELLEHVEEELGHLLALALDQVQNFADLVAAQA